MSHLHPTMLSKLGGDGQKPLLSGVDNLVDFEAPPGSALWEGPSAAGAAKVGASPGAPTPAGAPTPSGLFPGNRGSLFQRQLWAHGAGSVLWDRD